MTPSNPRKVLLLAYYFPPLGGAGSLRLLSFAQYLPEFGWEPIIVTVGEMGIAGEDPSVLGKLDDSVKEVRFSSRLTESACCLVADEYGMNANMERIMKAMNQEVPKSKRILELNPNHPIMQTLGTMFAADKDNPRLVDYCELLLDQALLTEGSPIKDPLRFTRLVSELMVKAG